MAEIAYTYTRNAPNGRHCSFTDTGPTSLIEYLPDTAEQTLYTPSPSVETLVDHTSSVANMATNTPHCSTVPQGMGHLVGGWPLSVDPGEAEARWKYIEKMEREEPYPAAVAALGPVVINSLRANNTVDLYEEYLWGGGGGAGAGATSGSNSGGKSALGSGTCFTAANNYSSSGAPDLKLRNVLTGGYGEVTGIAWSPFGTSRLAVAHSASRFLPGLVWDSTEPNKPIAQLCPHKDCLTSVSYSTKDMHIVAGGASDGTIYCWDTRAGPRAVNHTPTEHSHLQAVTALKFMTAKSGETLSTSLDGTVRVWDLRRLDRAVTHNALPLTRTGGSWGTVDEMLGGVSMDYDPVVGGPSAFLIGTQEGCILDCSKKDEELLSLECYNAHHGPVHAVQRCPSHPSLFLSGGDWRSRLWFDNCQEAVWTTPYSPHFVTYLVWQHKRSALFLRAMLNGCIEAWDLVYKQNAPTVTQRLSNSPLTHLALHADGEMLAAGDSKGNLHIVQLEGALVEDRPEYHTWLDLLLKAASQDSRDGVSPSAAALTRPASCFLFASRSKGAPSPVSTGGTMYGATPRGRDRLSPTPPTPLAKWVRGKEVQVQKPSSDVAETYHRAVEEAMDKAMSRLGGPGGGVAAF